MERFCVWQFLDGDVQEKVREWVPAEEAMKAFQHYISNVATKMGITQRVIIVDSGDCTVAEWKKGEGVVWPKAEDKN